jgi:type IV pilus assembly protein PilB
MTMMVGRKASMLEEAPLDGRREVAAARRRGRRLGELLIEAGVVSSETVAMALARQKETGERLGKILIEMGNVSEQAICEAIAAQTGFPFLDLKKVKPEEQAMLQVPEHIARRFQVIPVALADGKLTLGMVDPLDVLAVDDIHRVTQFEIIPAVIMHEDFLAALNQYPALDESLESTIREIKVTSHDDDIAPERLRQMVDEAPVVRLVNMIILQAIRQRASDIHLEPQETRMRVRYRIDGTLYNVMTPPRDIQAAVISRIKIMAEMDIAERRRSQDGRIVFKSDGREFDLRVNTIPTVFGEKVVMRILDKSTALVGLEKIGLLPEDHQRFETMMSKPYGIILLTGPTGSGKTTTLYSMLSRLNSTESNITTIEDPVEYQLPGVNQVQVNPKANVTFATGLRAFLRQDPDIIMVGEVRDEETARITIHAALTGHLVLSTLHTNDAPGAVARLVDMGIEPFLVASSVIGVVAQRLVRVLCERCKQPFVPPPELLKRLGVPEGRGNGAKICRPAGCDFCGGIGYQGRTGLYEIMLMDDELRALVVKNSSASVLREAAVRGGMRTLAHNGMEKVLLGITTAEEVLRAVYVEE